MSLRNSNFSRQHEVNLRHFVVWSLFSVMMASFTWAYQPAMARRDWLRNMLSVAPSCGAAVCFPLVSHAEENPVAAIQEGRNTLTTLLDNWERATVDCTFADVPRELLDTKNKEELLEKASTYALFDKSTSVVTCKTTNRNVRDYLGVTGKGPLVGMEKRLRKCLDLIDPDRLDDYVNGT